MYIVGLDVAPPIGGIRFSPSIVDTWAQIVDTWANADKLEDGSKQLRFGGLTICL